MADQHLDDAGFDLIFKEARSYNGWHDRDIDDDVLQKIYDMMRYGPTSANCCPMRLIFVKSDEAKEKLKPCLMEGNVEKTMSAPVTVLMANDMDFYEHMPFLFPHTDAKSWFVGKEKFIASTAERNGTLQAAYFMIAARGFGLDCGPMTGFSPKKTKEAFFPDQNVVVNMLCNLGYGDPESIFERSPRFPFDDVCKVV